MGGANRVAAAILQLACNASAAAPAGICAVLGQRPPAYATCLAGARRLVRHVEAAPAGLCDVLTRRCGHMMPH